MRLARGSRNEDPLEEPDVLIVCHDCLVEQRARYVEESGDGGWLQICVNCGITMSHYPA